MSAHPHSQAQKTRDERDILALVRLYWGKQTTKVNLRRHKTKMRMKTNEDKRQRQGKASSEAWVPRTSHLVIGH